MLYKGFELSAVTRVLAGGVVANVVAILKDGQRITYCQNMELAKRVVDEKTRTGQWSSAERRKEEWTQISLFETERQKSATADQRSQPC